MYLLGGDTTSPSGLYAGLCHAYLVIIIIIIIIQHLYSAIVSYAGCRGACGAS